MRPARRPSGFTFVEMIIAIGLAVTIVASVYSATQSMSETARRQREITANNLRREKFVEILRRDVRGWVVPTELSPSIQQPERADGEEELLRFSTSADGVAGSLQSGAETGNRGLTGVRYVVRKMGEKSAALVRIENSEGNRTVELILLDGKAPVRIDFFDGAQWMNQWSGKGRPVLVRATIAGQSVSF
ncbi:MAG TPA: hypothetical protein VEK08_14835 [Planctomycetota bacterium]|nr:hypothetical protein [Planctomycetota bacterium]